MNPVLCFVTRTASFPSKLLLQPWPVPALECPTASQSLSFSQLLTIFIVWSHRKWEREHWFLLPPAACLIFFRTMITRDTVLKFLALISVNKIRTCLELLSKGTIIAEIAEPWKWWPYAGGTQMACAAAEPSHAQDITSVCCSTKHCS